MIPAGPLPVLSIAVHPNSEADRDNLVEGVRRLSAEDPTMRADIEEQTGRTVIGAMSELQLEIILDRLRHEFHVAASVGRPRVAYKEALRQIADGDGASVDQRSGGRDHARVKVRVHPGVEGSGYLFDSAAVGGAIPRRLVESISKGIEEATRHGVVAGCHVMDVRVDLCAGSWRGDSPDKTLAVAAARAFSDAASKARPVLLEPIMRVEVIVPSEHSADVIGNLIARHGRIVSSDERGDTQVVRALVPLAEMFGYAPYLRECTRGRASYSQHLECYQPVRDGSNDDRDALVGAPLRPTPRSNLSAVALPEPEETM